MNMNTTTMKKNRSPSKEIHSAKIFQGHSNHQRYKKNGYRQILHIIGRKHHLDRILCLSNRADESDGECIGIRMEYCRRICRLK